MNLQLEHKSKVSKSATLHQDLILGVAEDYKHSLEREGFLFFIDIVNFCFLKHFKLFVAS